MQRDYYNFRYPHYVADVAPLPAYDAQLQATERVVPSPPPQMNYSDLGRI